MSLEDLHGLGLTPGDLLGLPGRWPTTAVVLDEQVGSADLLARGGSGWGRGRVLVREVFGALEGGDVDVVECGGSVPEGFPGGLVEVVGTLARADEGEAKR